MIDRKLEWYIDEMLDRQNNRQAEKRQTYSTSKLQCGTGVAQYILWNSEQVQGPSGQQYKKAVLLKLTKTDTGPHSWKKQNGFLNHL